MRMCRIFSQIAKQHRPPVHIQTFNISTALKKSICIFIVVACSLLLSSCASWYKRSAEFQVSISKGDFEQAEKLLVKDRKQAEGRNKILYYLNQGYVEFMLGQPEKSNAAFERAEALTEDQHRNLLTEAAVLISNPEMCPYIPEDFEVIMINFYKAMNYLKMNDMEAALIEVRKINIKLHQLNDKYPDHKNRYQQDAFAHLLMGLIYDASGLANDAFIAYRNAYDIYESDYLKNFGFGAPAQLKQDLMRTAAQCGFSAELAEYEKKFQMKYISQPKTADGELVFFWMNGMGPVKAEWGLSFVKQKRADGAIVFHNEEMGLAFPFFGGSGYSETDLNSIANLKILRVVFPKYVERPPLYKKAVLEYNGQAYALEMAEDINAIAFKTLHDRMLREFSNSLLRLAAKQGVQYAASKQNEWLGLAVSIANAVTEKADTRNWQTLPYSIFYSRVPLNAAENQIGLKMVQSNGKSDTQPVTIEGDKGKTRFFVYTTL